MSAVYILASPGLRFTPEAGAISLLAEKRAVFAGYVFALGFCLRESGLGRGSFSPRARQGWPQASSASRQPCFTFSVRGTPSGSVRSLPGGSLGTRAMVLERSSPVRRGLRPSAGTVAESVHPCEIEPVEALSDGLWMTAELLGDLGGTQSCQLKEMIRALKICHW